METLLELKTTVNLRDSYDGSSPFRSAELGETSLSELEKLIKKGEGFALVKRHTGEERTNIFEYSLSGETNKAELSFVEDIYACHYVKITAKLKDPVDIQAAYKRMEALMKKTLASLEALGKLSK